MTRFSLRLAASAAAVAFICTTSAMSAPEPPLTEAENSRVLMVRYETAIQANPDDLEARLGLAKALTALGEYDRAEKMAELVLRRTGKIDARLALAEVILRQGRVEDALLLLNAVEDIGEQGETLKYIILGEQALASGDLIGAMRAVQPAISDPHYARMARVVAARALYAQGDLARAKRLVDDIIADGGDSMLAQLFRARLALRAGDAGTARRLADGIDALDPGNVSAGAIVVEALMREGKLAEAKDRLAKLRPASLDDPRPAYLNGILLAAEGKTRDAAMAVGGIEEWLTLTDGGAVFLSDLKAELGFTGQAEAILRERLNGAPTDLAAIRALVTLLEREGREEDSDDVLKRSLNLMPGHPILSRLQADRLAARGDFDAAIAMMADQPDAAGALDLWAGLGDNQEAALAAQMFAAIRAGDPGQAVKLGMAASQDDPMVQNMLAAALAEEGDRNAAAKVLDRLIASEPDFLAAIVNRAGLNPSPTALTDALQQAVAAGATSAQIFRQLAIESYVIGDTSSALEAAQKASNADDNLDGDQLLSARIFLAEERKDDAAKILREVVYGANVAPADHIYRVWLLSLAGDTDGAVSQAEGIVVPHSDLNAGLMLADVFKKAEDRKNEARVLATLRRSHMTDLGLTERYLLALAADDLGRAQSLLAGQAGLNDDVKNVLGVRLLIEAGDEAAAQSKMSTLPPSAPLFALQAGRAENEAAQEELLGRMARFAQANPSDASVLVLLSGVAIEVDDMARAERALATALAAMPENPAVLNNLALVRKERAPEEALRLAAEAYAAVPDQPAFAETYASLLAENGDRARAGRIARRALLAEPSAESLQIFRDFGAQE